MFRLGGACLTKILNLTVTKYICTFELKFNVYFHYFLIIIINFTIHKHIFILILSFLICHLLLHMPFFGTYLYCKVMFTPGVADNILMVNFIMQLWLSIQWILEGNGKYSLLKCEGGFPYEGESYLLSYSKI